MNYKTVFNILAQEFDRARAKNENFITVFAHYSIVLPNNKMTTFGKTVRKLPTKLSAIASHNITFCTHERYSVRIPDIYFIVPLNNIVRMILKLKEKDKSYARDTEGSN